MLSIRGALPQRHRTRYGRPVTNAPGSAAAESALLREAADRLGWTAYKVAQESGIAQSTVSYVLAGERAGRPAHATAAVFAALATALQIPLAQVEELRSDAAEIMRRDQAVDEHLDLREVQLRRLSDDQLYDLITNAVKEARRRAGLRGGAQN